jgi:hypothetical protein
MRLTWNIIEAWKKVGNGKRKVTMAPWHPLNTKNTPMNFITKQTRKEQWVALKICCCIRVKTHPKKKQKKKTNV